ncbi:MAG: CAP domain-containing protein [Pseudomonadota bacterium]
MSRSWIAAGLAMLALAACDTEASREREAAAQWVELQYTMLDSVNALRAVSGVPPVAWDSRLAAAAQDHAVDIARQERPWAWGTDRSNPEDRLVRWGYPGTLIGEIYSQTVSINFEPLSAWLDDPNWRNVILNEDATSFGFAFETHPNQNVFWVLNMAELRTLEPVIN